MRHVGEGAGDERTIHDARRVVIFIPQLGMRGSAKLSLTWGFITTMHYSTLLLLSKKAVYRVCIKS